LPVGEALVYQLEPNLPPPWSNMSKEQWLSRQGTVVRLTFVAEHETFGSWTLTTELDIKDGRQHVQYDIS
jgi:hypothetical protein